MITADSTWDEQVAHHRTCIAGFERSLAEIVDGSAEERALGLRPWLESRIRGHRERLEKLLAEGGAA